ncbi:MAG: glycerol-3-phosphate 1-O-acyltransferase PlsY [Peptoniphilaceae bacterium]
MSLIISLLLSYLIGSISGSYLLGLIFLKKDVREFGSGNAGTTNAIRAFGKKWGILTFIIDFIKGTLVMILFKEILNFDDFNSVLCALFAIIGHDYPFYMNFKGGKGVATTIGSMAIFNFKLTLISVLIWILITLISKMVSLGSISFFLSLVILFSIAGIYDIKIIIIIFLIALLGIFRHHTNISRIIRGKENKIGVKKK